MDIEKLKEKQAFIAPLVEILDEWSEEDWKFVQPTKEELDNLANLIKIKLYYMNQLITKEEYETMLDKTEE